MAGVGPVPKQQHQRERDTRRRQSGAVSVAQDGVIRGPELPLEDPHPQTVIWWDAWRTSPQAQLFEDTDWQSLLRAALLVDYVWKSSKPSAAAISEIRLIEERLGATYVDRQRARITISREEAEVVPLRPVGSSLRDRMRKGGQEGRK